MLWEKKGRISSNRGTAGVMKLSGCTAALCVAGRAAWAQPTCSLVLTGSLCVYLNW